MSRAGAVAEPAGPSVAALIGAFGDQFTARTRKALTVYKRGEKLDDSL